MNNLKRNIVEKFIPYYGIHEEKLKNNIKYLFLKSIYECKSDRKKMSTYLSQAFSLIREHLHAKFDSNVAAKGFIGIFENLSETSHDLLVKYVMVQHGYVLNCEPILLKEYAELYVFSMRYFIFSDQKESNSFIDSIIKRFNEILIEMK